MFLWNAHTSTSIQTFRRTRQHQPISIADVTMDLRRFFPIINNYSAESTLNGNQTESHGISSNMQIRGSRGLAQCILAFWVDWKGQMNLWVKFYPSTWTRFPFFGLFSCECPGEIKNDFFWKIQKMATSYELYLLIYQISAQSD